jgi:hypothetical protein
MPKDKIQPTDSRIWNCFYVHWGSWFSANGKECNSETGACTSNRWVFQGTFL